MPRYRFKWENLPKQLLQALGSGLQLKGEPAQLLSQKYGTRPKESFVQDAWPILLEEWLQTDSVSLGSLAKSLRSRNLGQSGITDDYEYLKTCKNTANLRHEVLCILLTKGELSDSSEQPTETRNNPKATTADNTVEGYKWQRPKSLDKATLMEFALEAVSCLYNVDKKIIYIDTDGDILAPSGSAAVFLSAIEDREFRVFSPMVQNVNVCDDLFRVLNEINAKLRHGRIFCIGDQVILEEILDAGHASLYTLGFIVGTIGNIADFYDHKIQDRFGGSLFLRERAEDEINV